MSSTYKRARIQLIALILLALPGFMACEKEVNINLPATTAGTVVVEGGIENDQYPIVLLTRSIGFFSRVDLSTIQGSFIHDALVQVSDGSQTITLKEYSIDTAAGGVRFYFYTIDPADSAALQFKGRSGRFYKLSISHDGKVYESVSQIPALTPLDTFYYEPAVNAPASAPNARQLWFRYSDPDTPGNYMRYYISRNSGPYYGGSAMTDEIINGTTLTTDLWPGSGAQDEFTGDSVRYVFPGETIRLRWCAIDRDVYNFWTTFSFARNSVGNPFSSPLNAQTNISNGGLGVWAGYGASYYELQIQ